MFENNLGFAQLMQSRMLKQFIKNQLHIKLATVMACHSAHVASVLFDAGVGHVVCVEGKINDSAAKLFVEKFYDEVF